MNHELELAFYKRLTVCFSLCSLSPHSIICICGGNNNSVTVFHSIKQHFNIQLHTPTQYMYTHSVCVGAEYSCGQVAAEAGVCLSRLLRSRRGWGWQRQLGSPNECLTSPGTLPLLSARRYLAPLCLRAPHLTSRQLVPSLVWPHGLPTLPLELVSLWFWQRLGFRGWCQGTVKGKQINRS